MRTGCLHASGSDACLCVSLRSLRVTKDIQCEACVVLVISYGRIRDNDKAMRMRVPDTLRKRKKKCNFRTVSAVFLEKSLNLHSDNRVHEYETGYSRQKERAGSDWPIL